MFVGHACMLVIIATRADGGIVFLSLLLLSNIILESKGIVFYVLFICIIIDDLKTSLFQTNSP